MQHFSIRQAGRGLGLIALAWVLALLWMPAARAAEEAADLTEAADITVEGGSSANIQDGSYSTSWKVPSGTATVDISLPAGQPAAGLYLCWGTVPAAYEVQVSADAESWTTLYAGNEDTVRHIYVDLGAIASAGASPAAAPAGLSSAQASYRYIRVQLTSGDDSATLTELRLLGPGTVPDDIQRWSPTTPDADIMIFSAHPDDESVFFSGVLPWYGGEKGYAAISVYMAPMNNLRRIEGLNAVWTTGVHTQPVFGPFPDQHTTTEEECARLWGREETLQYVVQMLREYKPEVIVTHDVNGEYGHGAHMLTSWAVREAVTKAADPTYDPESAEEYGTWQVLKCYIHLYDENPLVMDLSLPMSRFGGQTVLEVAKQALNMHVSQLHFQVVYVHESGAYSSTRYGLYYSAVGPDTGANDMFENIP